MKCLISIFASISIIMGMFPALSVLAIDETIEIQSFIDDSLSLIKQAPEITEEKVSNNGVIQVDEDLDAYREFEMCRLIVESDDIPDKLNSIGIASGFMDYHIIQFKNENDAKEAYEYYKEQYDIISVIPDCVNVDFGVIEQEKVSKNTLNVTEDRLNSWGGVATGLYDLKDYLKANKVPKNEVVVAVLDSGVDFDHEFLEGRLIETKFNATGKEDGYSEIDDGGTGHGTMVTSVIVDSTPDNIKVANYKVLQKESIESIVSISIGILQAAMDDVDIINASWSIPDYTENYGLIVDAVKTAYDNNITIVSSAGNMKDQLLTETKFVPASTGYAIVVAASDEKNLPAGFTARGPLVDLTAPGVDITVAGLNNTYQLASGTSFSAPLTASACAILKSLNPELKPEEMRERLKETACPFDEICMINTEYFGPGLLDAIAVSGLKRQKNVISNYKSGKYIDEMFIKLISDDSSEIYYTIDQTVPSKVNGIRYTEPIAFIDDNVIFRAVAYNEDDLPSKVFSAFYRSSVLGEEKDFTIDENGTILTYSGNLHDIVIPETINGTTVKDLANGAFDESEVIGVTLPNSIVNLTGGFYGNEKILFVDGESVKEVGDYVFQSVGTLYSLDLPNMEKAGEEAFCKISAGRVVFPKLEHAGYKCFSDSLFLDLQLPELIKCGAMTFSESSFLNLYIPKLKEVDEPYLWEDKWPFIGATVTNSLDLASLESVCEEFFVSEASIKNGYIERVEFSKLKELKQLPDVLSQKTLMLVLPSTIETLTAGRDYYLEKAIIKIYGTSGTLVETWAKEIGFEFIEITSETAVITDLPEYYKSYMGELEADVVGFNRQYQWYENTVNSNEGGTPIEGATSKKFNPSDYPAPYYYCEVTSTDKGYCPVVIKTSACENRSIEFADYSPLEKALAKVPADLSIYTVQTRENLESLIKEAETPYELTQKEIDELAEKIETAISELKLITITLSKSEVTLRYKETCSISTESESNVTWFSINPDVATVDQNGNIVATGRGTTEIVAKIENGEKDICTVNVKFTWWQWLIYIFLFGWIWY